jgi:hypothetical protein
MTAVGYATSVSGLLLPYGVEGVIAVNIGTAELYNDTGHAVTVASVRASVGTAPTGADIIVDINKNGTTIFTNQANRPRIIAGMQTSGAVTNMDVKTVANGEFFTVDVDQVGSGIAGANLTVQILLT